MMRASVEMMDVISCTSEVCMKQVLSTPTVTSYMIRFLNKKLTRYAIKQSHPVPQQH